MGGKGHAFLRDLAQLGKAEHLESAAVGQDGPVPAGKFVQTAHIGYQLITGTQMQVVGVAEHHLGADLLQILRGQAALDGTGGGNILESRGLHRAMHGLELTRRALCSCLSSLKVVKEGISFFLSVYGKQPYSLVPPGRRQVQKRWIPSCRNGSGSVLGFGKAGAERSQDQHRIAEGKEAVLFLYGNFIGSHGLFVAVEGRDQHDEGAFRQVEVGDQAIDAVELDTRVEKIEVLPLQALISPYFAAAASSVRQLVVPTAITRCPAALVSRMR